METNGFKNSKTDTQPFLTTRISFALRPRTLK
jgi:hypothetical protein